MIVLLSIAAAGTWEARSAAATNEVELRVWLRTEADGPRLEVVNIGPTATIIDWERSRMKLPGMSEAATLTPRDAAGGFQGAIVAPVELAPEAYLEVVPGLIAGGGLDVTVPRSWQTSGTARIELFVTVDGTEGVWTGLFDSPAATTPAFTPTSPVPIAPQPRPVAPPPYSRADEKALRVTWIAGLCAGAPLLLTGGAALAGSTGGGPGAREDRRAGAGFAVAGTALVTTGLIALVVDMKLRKRRRLERSPARTLTVPAIDGP